MEGWKVISANEMRRIESLAYKEGHLDEDFMENAGRSIANIILDLLQSSEDTEKVTFLIGKGNNGGDGYVAARILHKQKIPVKVYHLFSLDDSSALCCQKGKEYIQSGGTVHFVTNAEDIFLEGMVVDAILGTGFLGKVEGLIFDVIAKVNEDFFLTLAVDVPSGLNATTGEVNPIAIKAHCTLCLGLPKTGYFVQSGYEHVGELLVVDFGLPNKYIEQAQEEYIYPFEEDFIDLLPPIIRTRHKYSAGSITAISGSPSMMGAAALSTLAAYRAGAGIVKLLTYGDSSKANMPYEVISSSWTDLSPKECMERCNHSSAVFMGPGLGRDKAVEKLLQKLIPSVEVPCVLDADALYFFAHHLDISLPKNTIITPHKKEMLRLLGQEKTSEDFLKKCQQFAQNYSVILVLKGAPTFVFAPDAKPLIFTWGDPGMATAGVGDVLTGIITAFLAQGMRPYDAACLGVYVHGIAGEIAAVDVGSYSLMASDIIKMLPSAFMSILENEI